MSLPLRNESRRGLAGMQRAMHQWSGPEAKAGTRLRNRYLDGCYGNRRLTDALKERRAPSSVRKKERKEKNYIAHFPNAQMCFTVSNRLLSIP